MSSLPDIILPKREFFGLSIDRMCLRGIQLDRRGKLTRSAEVPFSKNIFDQSLLTEGDEFRIALETIKEKGDFTTPYVSVCFPEAFAYTRELTLPKVSFDEIGEGVHWHVKELFPFPEDDLYVDWKLIRTLDTEYAVAVVAVPKRTIDPLVNSIVSVGLRPLRLTPDASAISKLLGLAEEAHAIVTEVNRTGAYVTFVEGEKAVFTTVVSYTKNDTPTTYLANVKQTIQEISTYYREKNIIREASVETIVTGEVASQAWVKELPSPARMLTTPIGNPAFTKAYASALSQVSHESTHESINLLPPHLQKVYDKERTDQYYLTVVNRTTAIVGAYTLVIGLIFGLFMYQRQIIDANVKRLNAIVSSQGVNSQALLSVNGIAKQIVALAPLRKTPREQLTTFLSLIPEGVTVSQWNYDDASQEYSISGVAVTRDALFNLRTMLEESNQFERISLPLSYLESPTDIPFTLTFIAKAL